MFKFNEMMERKQTLNDSNPWGKMAGQQAWADMLANSPWSAFARAAAEPASEQAISLRSGQDEPGDETKNLVERWTARRHESVQSAWTLISELQSARAPAKAMAAWASWSEAAIDRVSDDARDQLEFTSKVAQRCTAMLPVNVAAFSPATSQPDDTRPTKTSGKKNGKTNGHSQ